MASGSRVIEARVKVADGNIVAADGDSISQNDSNRPDIIDTDQRFGTIQHNLFSGNNTAAMLPSDPGTWDFTYIEMNGKRVGLVRDPANVSYSYSQSDVDLGSDTTSHWKGDDNIDGETGPYEIYTFPRVTISTAPTPDSPRVKARVGGVQNTRGRIRQRAKSRLPLQEFQMEFIVDAKIQVSRLYWLWQQTFGCELAWNMKPNHQPPGQHTMGGLYWQQGQAVEWEPVKARKFWDAGTPNNSLWRVTLNLLREQTTALRDLSWAEYEHYDNPPVTTRDILAL